jgi:hypothetical protein
MANRDVNWRLFREGWTPSLSWWFGCLLGDGNVTSTPTTKRVSLVGAESTVQRWLDLVTPGKTSKAIRRSQGGVVNAVQGYVDSSELTQWLYERWGLRGPKAQHLPWPEDMPADCLAHFVRGLWDTDGSIYSEARRQRGNKGNDRVCAKYVSIDGVFMKRLVAALAPVVRGKAGVVTEPPRSTNHQFLYTYRVSGKGAHRLLDYLYGEAPLALRNEDRAGMYVAVNARRQAAKMALCPCGAPVARMGVCWKCWQATRAPSRVGKGTVCEVEGCSVEVFAKGRCGACYHRARRARLLQSQGKAYYPRRRRDGAVGVDYYGNVRVLNL